MIKEIETPFFDNVKEIWDKGIKVLEFEYKKAVLGYDTSKTPKLLVPKWEVSNQKAFATNLYWLFDEIKENLDECKGLALERYIFSLMMPFKGLADVLHNDNLARMGEESINKWKPFNEWVFDEIQRAKTPEPQPEETPEPQPEPEQAAPEPQNNKEGIYKGCVYTMSNLLGVAYVYANMLDAALLERGLDLLNIQRQVGITLLLRRDLTQIGHYLGTPERAKDLISRVAPKPELPQPQPEGAGLPDELNTQKAQKTFAKAIANGWIVRKPDGGFEWLGTDRKGSKAQLSYLCAKVYGYQYNVTKGNVGENVPYEALERLFNVTRLDRAMQQTFEAKKPQRWRGTIDQIITE